MKFIYVMQEKDKKKLETLGYHLIGKHQTLDVWCFENKEALPFADNDAEFGDMQFVLSDVLTFQC